MKEANRQRIATLLRRLHLLWAADWLLFVQDFISTFANNRDFLRANPNFASPPSLLAFDAYNTISLPAYYRVGKAYADKIVSTLLAHKPASRLHVLEWGCGPGRIIRQVQRQLETASCELHGTDFNGKSIEWCRRSLPGITFTQNGADPPLPYHEDHFDAVYAVSVLTHLDGASQLRWISEIARILKSGGLFVFTTHGENRLHKLSRDQATAFQKGELIIKGGYREGKKNFLAYHPRSFVKEAFSGKFKFLAFEDGSESGLGQDYWVFSKL
jgi:SAM-dependent methyltransferase